MYENDDDRQTQYREGIFVGVSRRTDEQEAILEDAVRNAYDKASGAGLTPPFRVLEIWVNGENPLTEYIVSLQAVG
jgi:hypothetical protein